MCDLGHASSPQLLLNSTLTPLQKRVGAGELLGPEVPAQRSVQPHRSAPKGLMIRGPTLSLSPTSDTRQEAGDFGQWSRML